MIPRLQAPSAQAALRQFSLDCVLQMLDRFPHHADNRQDKCHIKNTSPLVLLPLVSAMKLPLMPLVSLFAYPAPCSYG